MTATQTVTVLGTGIMGAPMARNLGRAGFALRVWNRTRQKAEALAGEGAKVCDTPSEAVEGADFVLTMLGDGAAVETTMTTEGGALGAMSPEAVWLQCSTVGVEATERLARLAKDRGVSFVDAPVLGTRQPAEQAKLVVLASGPSELEARCAPVFEAIGHVPRWLGGTGTGSRVKLVMNSWVLTVVGATSEALSLAEGLGVDPSLFLSTLEGTQLDCPYVHLKGDQMLEGRFAAAFSTTGARKDIDLIRQSAERCGLPAEVLRALDAKFQRALDAGLGEKDMSAVFQVDRPGHGG